MAELQADDLGVAADPLDPADLARGLGAILEQPSAAYEAMRARCLRISRDRYNWETAVGPYLELVEHLAAPPSTGED